MATAKTSLKALSSFFCTVGDQEHFIREGEVVAGNHPAVKGHEELFVPHDPTKPTTS